MITASSSGSASICVIVEIGFRRPVEARHALDQIASHVADRVEVGIAGLLAGFEMRELGNRPAAEHAYPQPALLLGDRHRAPPICSLP